VSKETYAKLVIYHLTKATEAKTIESGLKHLHAALGILAGYDEHQNGEPKKKDDLLLQGMRIATFLSEFVAWLGADSDNFWRIENGKWIPDSGRYYEDYRPDNIKYLKRNYSWLIQLGHYYMAKLGLGEAVDIPDISEFIKGGITKKATEEDEEDEDTY